MNNELLPLFGKGMNSEELHRWMDICSKDKVRFYEFWTIAQDPDEKYAWRALWVIEHACTKNTELLDIILLDLYKFLHTTNNNSLLRIGLKLINMRPALLTDDAGRLLTKSETLLLDPKVPVATRANALFYIFQMCKQEHELANELEIMINHIEENGSSAAFRSRFRIIRKEIKKWRSQEG